MSTRRRVIGISTATTEAARRHLMQPVPCWEQVWVTPSTEPAHSTLKILKWIKTDKKQQFSDDEGEVDEPLAPLPDETEVVEVDEEMDPDEVPASAVTGTTPILLDITEANSVALDSTEVPDANEAETKPPTPARETLSLEPVQPAVEESADLLEELLQPMDGDIGVDVDETVDPEALAELDMTTLGPDGTAFEEANDLSQLESTDALLGGPLLDSTVDPFAEPSEQTE